MILQAIKKKKESIQQVIIFIARIVDDIFDIEDSLPMKVFLIFHKENDH